MDSGLHFQTLVSVTGSGKTFTTPNVIARSGRIKREIGPFTVFPGSQRAIPRSNVLRAASSVAGRRRHKASTSVQRLSTSAPRVDASNAI